MTFRLLLVAVLTALVVLSIAPAKAQVPPREAEKYKRDVVRNARLVFGLDAPIAVLAGQIEQESGWNEKAQSRVGAQGIAQFMPGTARDMAKKLGDAADPLNAAWALRAHSRYMYDLYHSIMYPTECDVIGAALSSYNGGAGWHARRRSRAPDPDDFWGSVRLINPGITASNQIENQEYPVRIVRQRQPKYKTWGRTVCL